MRRGTCDECDQPATHLLSEIVDGLQTSRRFCATHAPDAMTVVDIRPIQSQLADFIRKAAEDAANQSELFEHPALPDRDEYLAELRRIADDLESGIE